MKYLGLIIISILFQGLQVTAQTQNDNVVNEEVGLLHEKQIRKMPTQGSYYLTDTSTLLTIIQQDEVVHKDVLGRYNIRDDRFEIGGIAIAGRSVAQFEQGDQVYIRASGSTYPEDLKDVFLRVLHTGVYDLYASQNVIFKPSNYNLLMDTGSRSDAYVKEEIYLVYEKDSLVLKTKSIKKVGKYISDQTLEKVKKKRPRSEQEVVAWLTEIDQP